MLLLGAHFSHQHKIISHATVRDSVKGSHAGHLEAWFVTMLNKMRLKLTLISILCTLRSQSMRARQHLRLRKRQKRKLWTCCTTE
jgi:hypothetical protein